MGPNANLQVVAIVTDERDGDIDVTVPLLQVAHGSGDALVDCVVRLTLNSMSDEVASTRVHAEQVLVGVCEDFGRLDAAGEGLFHSL